MGGLDDMDGDDIVHLCFIVFLKSPLVEAGLLWNM